MWLFSKTLKNHFILQSLLAYIVDYKKPSVTVFFMTKPNQISDFKSNVHLVFSFSVIQF